MYTLCGCGPVGHRAVQPSAHCSRSRVSKNNLVLTSVLIRLWGSTLQSLRRKFHFSRINVYRPAQWSAKACA